MSRVEETLMRTVVVRSARRCGIIIGRTILFFFFRVTRHDRGIRWWHVKQTIEQVAIDVAARCRSITGEIKHSTQATIPLSIRVYLPVVLPGVGRATISGPTLAPTSFPERDASTPLPRPIDRPAAAAARFSFRIRYLSRLLHLVTPRSTIRNVIRPSILS